MSSRGTKGLGKVWNGIWWHEVCRMMNGQTKTAAWAHWVGMTAGRERRESNGCGGRKKQITTAGVRYPFLPSGDRCVGEAGRSKHSPENTHRGRIQLSLELRGFFGLIDRTAEDVTGWERGGVTHSKGPQARTWTLDGNCSEDKASVHGTLALPTELNGAPGLSFFKWITWCSFDLVFFGGAGLTWHLSESSWAPCPGSVCTATAPRTDSVLPCRCSPLSAAPRQTATARQTEGLQGKQRVQYQRWWKRYVVVAICKSSSWKC